MKLTKPLLSVLERVFAGEPARYPVQIRESKAVARCLEEHLICIVTEEETKGMSVTGYRMTHRGMIAFCGHCAEQHDGGDE